MGEPNERRMRIEQLEREKAGLLEDVADVVPEALAELMGEERHQIYRMLRLEVFVHPTGTSTLEGYRERFLYPRGNTFRKPPRYGLLTSPEVEKLFVRVDAHGEAFGRTKRRRVRNSGPLISRLCIMPPVTASKR